MTMNPEDEIKRVETCVKAMLESNQFLHMHGDVLDKEVMLETPKRVQRMWAELLEGYNMSPKLILSKQFGAESTAMVTETDIQFCSTCEHHTVPFFGKAAISYLPKDGKVVGISKLARLVDCYSRRYQTQERMTHQIAEAVKEYLSIDCAVHTIAIHSCMIARGARKMAVTKVTEVRGEYEKQHVKEEFLWNCKDMKVGMQ